MEKFDIRNYKYLLATIFIFIIFILVVAHAYRYLPSQDESNKKLNNVNYELKNQNTYNNLLEDSNIEEDEDDIDNENSTDEEENGDISIQDEFEQNAPFKEISEEDIEQ